MNWCARPSAVRRVAGTGTWSAMPQARSAASVSSGNTNVQLTVAPGSQLTWPGVAGTTQLLLTMVAGTITKLRSARVSVFGRKGGKRSPPTEGKLAGRVGSAAIVGLGSPDGPP